jgi:alpha-1,3-rhamnosyl/mannosyltransferase
MRVLVNTLCTIGQKTGVGNYTAQLAACLPDLLAPGEYLEAFPGWGTRLLYRGYQMLQPRGGLRGSAAVAEPAGAPSTGWRGLLQRLRDQVRGLLPRAFARRVARGGIAVYHEPNNIPFPTDVPTIVTLHDLSVQLYPQWHPAVRVQQHEQHLRQGLDRWAHIITVSEVVRQEIILHLGVAPHRVSCTHQGVRPGMVAQPPRVIASVRRRLRLPADYLLYVGTLEPRKNLLLLLRAYVRLPASVRASIPLVLAGGFGWKVDELRTYLDSTAKQAGVIHLGYVADGDLPALYSGARALLFPSFYEGFGLPPLEMQACGGAVIASTAAAVAEVLAGSPACLLDPHDEDAWFAALLRVCADQDFACGLRAGAAGAAARFSWRTTAERTLAVYRTVASGQTGPIRKAG